LIDLFLQGRLPLDRFVSETIGIEDIEDAFAKMREGKVLRSVVGTGPRKRIDAHRGHGCSYGGGLEPPQRSTTSPRTGGVTRDSVM